MEKKGDGDGRGGGGERGKKGSRDNSIKIMLNFLLKIPISISTFWPARNLQMLTKALY